jgi:hypothetical protein
MEISFWLIDTVKVLIAFLLAWFATSAFSVLLIVTACLVIDRSMRRARDKSRPIGLAPIHYPHAARIRLGESRPIALVRARVNSQRLCKESRVIAPQIESAVTILG